MPCHVCGCQKATLQSLFPLLPLCAPTESNSSHRACVAKFLPTEPSLPVCETIFVFVCQHLDILLQKHQLERLYKVDSCPCITSSHLKNLSRAKHLAPSFCVKKSVGLLSVTHSLQAVYQSLNLRGTDLKEGLHKSISRANTTQNSVSWLLLTVNFQESLHCCLRGNTLCLKVCLEIISGTCIALITLVGLHSTVRLCLPGFCFRSFIALGTLDIPCLRLCYRLLALLVHCFCAPLCHFFPVRTTSRCERWVVSQPSHLPPLLCSQNLLLSLLLAEGGRICIEDPVKCVWGLSSSGSQACWSVSSLPDNHLSDSGT